jgi:hypothetical protein
MNDQLFVLSTQKKKTSHILHLLLCIPTCGFWLIPWFFIAQGNSLNNSSIDRKMKKIVSHKIEGKTDMETHQAIVEENQHKNKVVFVFIVTVLIIIWLANRH